MSWKTLLIGLGLGVAAYYLVGVSLLQGALPASLR
jgi:predicted small secreted protein